MAYHNYRLIYIHTHTHTHVYALHKLKAISNTIVVACFFVFILITWPEYHNTTNNIFTWHQKQKLKTNHVIGWKIPRDFISKIHMSKNASITLKTIKIFIFFRTCKVISAHHRLNTVLDGINPGSPYDIKYLELWHQSLKYMQSTKSLSFKFL